MSARVSRRWLKLLAVLAVFGLLAAACGGDDSGSGGGATDQSSVPATDGDPDEGETPIYGGSITFAREAETSSPWAPSSMVCDLSCHQSIRTVYDTLTYLGEDDKPHPYMLESIEPNADFTVWTLTAREGITFHDGTPFDGAAIDDHLQRMRDSFLVGRSLLNVESQTVIDAMTVEVAMIDPWVTFPYYLSAQPGYVASPTWLAAVDAGTADVTEPVGSGPFMFGSYQPGSSFKVVRNPDYWLSDADGNQYPYLDEIEFVVQEEDQTRERALVSGEIDITHTDKGESVESLRGEVESGNLAMFEISDRPGTTYALINVDNPDSPVSDVRIRRALAHAVDQDLRNQSRSAGVYEIANGPFPPGTPGYLEDNGFPDYDPDKARELVAEYKADTGADTVAIQFDTTADPDNKATVELLQQMLLEVGIDVTIAQFEQGEFITNALNGAFEVFTWRNHGGTSPDTERVWWNSETAQPIGEIALNFGRIKDDVIDENLDTIRGSDDPAVVQEAAENINRQFADQVYNIWSDWIFWAIPHKNRVHGVKTPIALPDGTQSAIRSIGGVGGVGLAQVWVDDAG